MEEINSLSLRLSKIQLYKNKHNSICKIQSLFRGFILRKQNAKTEDCITANIILNSLNCYKCVIRSEIDINFKIKQGSKKIRLSNMPSHITENIVKYAFYKKYKLMPSWNTPNGDLILNKNNLNLKLEIKGSLNLNNGPVSFGPKENWDFLYFIDMQNLENNLIKIYELKISNTSDIWQSLKINKTQTFKDQCLQKRRPRLLFKKIQKQLHSYINILYEGNLSELFF